jgi:ATP-binding cassette subfamily B protein
MSVWRIAWRVSQHEPRSFWLGWITFVLFFMAPAVSGYFLGRGFDALQALPEGGTGAVYRYAALIAVTEAVRIGLIYVAAMVWSRVWVHMQTFLRANLLAAQLASGGTEAGRPVGSAGEAVTHFRDDTEDVVQFIDGIVDVSAGVLFTVLAGVVLGLADLRAALVLIAPLVAVGLFTRALDSQITSFHQADREETAAVTGLVGDVMAAATTVKVNGATDHVLDRLATLVERRRRTAVRDRVLNETVWAFSDGAVNVGFGLVLIVSASSIASGDLSVGTLALIAAYLGWLSFLPRMVGRLLARRKQAEVAVERMRQLVASGDPAGLVRRRDLPLEARQPPRRPAVVRPDRVRLDRLEVVELTARYRDGSARDQVAVGPVSFSAARGTFTVVTGPVGAGKTTLLRALLGLAHQADVTGEVRWNGRTVTDRGAFLVPPNAAFLPQVPQLLSDSIADNVSLGPRRAEQLAAALHAAAVADDVAAMPDGGDTLVGPRGLRLSGGQRQRLATARALVHEPELVVLDDLSSALDVETELRLWDNLSAAGLTVIAVSHRAVAIERADQVIRLG